MELPEYFLQLYDYHYWANHRILASVEGLTDEQLHLSHGQSWGSVHGTLLHIMNAEWIWLQRWQGESPKAFYRSENFPNLAPLREFWTNLETALLAFVAAQTTQSLEREITYTSTLGKTYQLILWQMMAQIPNHGTQHRNEIAAMLTAMTIQNPENDIVYYILEKTGQRESFALPLRTSR